MDHLTSRQFEDGNPVIAFHKMIGTSLDAIHLCSTTPYPNLMFQLTRFMSITARTSRITIRHYATSFCSRHHERSILRAIEATSDKRSQAVWLLTPPIFLFILILYFLKRIYWCVLWEPTWSCETPACLCSTSQSWDFVVLCRQHATPTSWQPIRPWSSHRQQLPRELVIYFWAT